MHHHTKFHQNRLMAAEILCLTFLARDVIYTSRARCNIYISRLLYDVSVRLSVRLSVTKLSAMAHFS